MPTTSKLLSAASKRPAAGSAKRSTNSRAAAGFTSPTRTAMSSQCGRRQTGTEPAVRTMAVTPSAALCLPPFDPVDREGDDLGGRHEDGWRAADHAAHAAAPRQERADDVGEIVIGK